MKTIAIITARGGSKRIPNKNIKEFIDRPIIAYSIKAALDSAAFDEVMVSTDSAEIAQIATDYGAKVPFFRSTKASDDYATTAEVLLEVLDEYEKANQIFDLLCCIYPTAPFVSAKTLNDCLNKIKSEKSIDSIVPVVPFSSAPQRALVVSGGGMLEYKYKENIKKRSQDLETFYYDAGQFYFAKVKDFLKVKNLVLPNCSPYILNHMQVQDIDTLEDWELAEFKYRFLHRNIGAK